MGYFRAKSDREFMKAFQGDVLDLYQREDTASSYRPPPRSLTDPPDVRQDPAYQQVRERIAKGVARAVRIGRSLGVPADLQSYLAPAVGGPVIPVDLFKSVLHDTSHGGIDHQWVIDALREPEAQS